MTVYYSKYNLIVPLEKFPDYSIIHNLFHGQATIVDSTLAKRLSQALAKEDLDGLPESDVELLTSRSFVYPSEEDENKQIKATYKSQREKRVSRAYTVLLTYACNLRCLYCFQKERHEGAPMSRPRLACALAAIDNLDKNTLAVCAEKGITPPPPELTLVGGESLQYKPEYMELWDDIIAFAHLRQIHCGISSNGYDLAKFVPEFVKRDFSPVIQITVDGKGSVHDQRRPHINGGSFDKIVEGIDAAVNAGLQISLRINLDRQNVEHFVELCRFMKDRGWCENGKVRPYLSPVEDHSGVNGDYEWIDSEYGILRTVIKKLRENPWLYDLFGDSAFKNFHGFHYVRSCVTEGMIAAPTFLRCGAVIGQSVFDPNGDYYHCFEAAGTERGRIGRFDPQLELLSEKSSEWEKLDSVQNPYCSGCRFAFVCAGGCPWHLLRTGKKQCIAIKQQVEIAWNYFADRVIEEETKAVSIMTAPSS